MRQVRRDSQHAGEGEATDGAGAGGAHGVGGGEQRGARGVHVVHDERRGRRGAPGSAVKRPSMFARRPRRASARWSRLRGRASRGTTCESEARGHLAGQLVAVVEPAPPSRGRGGRHGHHHRVLGAPRRRRTMGAMSVGHGAREPSFPGVLPGAHDARQPRRRRRRRSRRRRRAALRVRARPTPRRCTRSTACARRAPRNAGMRATSPDVAG